MSIRKMVLVPVQAMEELQKWKQHQTQKPRLPPNPQVTMTAQLQKDMQHTLDRVDLSESEKSQLYGENLHKFQVSHGKTTAPKGVTTTSMHDRILESVPKTMRRKTQLLLDLLRDHPNMSWDEQGTLLLNGKPVDGSHIIDLINDIIRERKHFEPRGWQTFSRGLKEVNVPQDIVGNRKRWDWMHSDTPKSRAKKMTVKTPGSAKRVVITPPTVKRKALKWEPY